jgi:cyclophilin family peptidyl-prolyl cis-trans isomerase
MRFGNWVFVGLVGLGLLIHWPGGSGFAQDANPAGAQQETSSDEPAPPVINDDTPTANEETPVREDGPARLEFDRLFMNWKTLLKDLRDLKTTYQLADESELSAIREDWNDKLAEGEAMVPTLRAAALAAYLESPNEDRELNRFLTKLAADLIRQDNYPVAKDVLLKLKDNGCDERGMDNLLGISGFGTNDFELAETHLTEAQRNGSLSEQGQKFYDSLSDVIAGWEREMQLREEESAAEEKLPQVLLETSAGDITVELLENEAPETVGNFVSLVEKGFYDGLPFHRVLEGFMAQAGCPNGDGSGGPGYKIYCESINENHRNHFAGSLSMAKEAARHTGGSQFFITFVPTSHLDGRHTVFGYVVDGLDVLPKISKIDPAARRAQDEPIVITKATVLNKRDHEYRPNKVK